MAEQTELISIQNSSFITTSLEGIIMQKWSQIGRASPFHRPVNTAGGVEARDLSIWKRELYLVYGSEPFALGEVLEGISLGDF